MKAGDPYRPSNGTEGLFFQERFCFNCERDRYFDDMNPEDGCSILACSYADVAEEWVYDRDGNPTCLSFCPRNACPIDARPAPPQQIPGQEALAI